MTPGVVRVGPNQLKALHNLLLESPHVGLDQPTSQYEVFRVRCQKGTIVGYTSGKVVASGSACEALLMEAILNMGEDKSRFEIVIGSDEAGKGEWLGPMVIAAVAISPSQSTYLRAHGVMDSKDLTLEKIDELVPEIEDHNLANHIVLLTPEAFNQRFREMHEEGKNLNDLLAWAHATAISNVYREIGEPPDSKVQVVVDEFARVKTKVRIERAMGLSSVELVQRHGAEDEIAVAAASIMARATRELWIDDASERMKIDLREMSIEEAREHPEKHRFAKVQYVR